MYFPTRNLLKDYPWTWIVRSLFILPGNLFSYGSNRWTRNRWVHVDHLIEKSNQYSLLHANYSNPILDLIDLQQQPRSTVRRHLHLELLSHIEGIQCEPSFPEGINLQHDRIHLHLTIQPGCSFPYFYCVWVRSWDRTLVKVLLKLFGCGILLHRRWNAIRIRNLPQSLFWAGYRQC